jgi:hypothetical protein
MSQQHDAVTGVSCGIGAEIAIGASVSRHQLRGSTWGSLQLVSTISRDCSASRLSRPWRCRFITFVIMCYVADILA